MVKGMRHTGLRIFYDRDGHPENIVFSGLRVPIVMVFLNYVGLHSTSFDFVNNL